MIRSAQYLQSLSSEKEVVALVLTHLDNCFNETCPCTKLSSVYERLLQETRLTEWSTDHYNKIQSNPNAKKLYIKNALNHWQEIEREELHNNYDFTVQSPKRFGLDTTVESSSSKPRERRPTHQNKLMKTLYLSAKSLIKQKTLQAEASPFK
jgi:hypothetical protein